MEKISVRFVEETRRIALDTKCYENARDQRRDSEISRRIQGNGRRTFRGQGKKEVGILFIHGLCTAHG